MNNTPDYLKITVTLNKTDIDNFYSILGAWEMGGLRMCRDLNGSQFLQANCSVHVTDEGRYCAVGTPESLPLLSCQCYQSKRRDLPCPGLGEMDIHQHNWSPKPIVED